jgi:peptide/nickel transport system substrate-binding protein
MENRFGVKDFFLFLIISVLIVLVLLAMKQYDRQWDVLQQTQNQVNNLTGDVARIRQSLAQGVVSAPTGRQPGQPNPLWTGLERVVKSYSSPDYAEGDNVVWVSLAPPDKLTPIINQDMTSQEIQGIVMDSLLGRDPNTFEFIPGLASSYTISDDQLTFDFILKRGITFSDGSPFTADDVVFTFELAKNPKIEAPWEQSLLDKIESVKKVDDYHVRFHFSSPYFMSLVTTSGMPIMSKAFYSKYSIDEFNQSTGLLIGTGAYRLADPTSWKPEPGKPIELVRNERYWGPRPSFNKIVIRVIENVTARATAFESADIDAFCGPDSGPTPEQYVHMLADKALLARSTHYSLDSPLEGTYFIAWNEKQGRDGAPSHFADPRVRRALTMLTDRKQLIRDILYGYGTIAHGPFHPLIDQGDPKLQPLPYDPDAAIKLLAQAGFVRKGDRMYEPDGVTPFVIKLTYPTSSDIRKRATTLIHDTFANAGIEVQIDGQEWSVFEQRQTNRQFDALMASWGGVIDDDLYQIFDSAFIEGAGDDWIQYQNKELDKTIEAARSTLDHDKRTALWRKCDDIIDQDQPYSFLWINREMDFMDSRFHGVEPTHLGINGFQEWYTPRALQKYSE